MVRRFRTFRFRNSCPQNIDKVLRFGEFSKNPEIFEIFYGFPTIFKGFLTFSIFSHSRSRFEQIFHKNEAETKKSVSIAFKG